MGGLGEAFGFGPTMCSASGVEVVGVVPSCFEGRCGVALLATGMVTVSAIPPGSRHVRHTALQAIRSFQTRSRHRSKELPRWNCIEAI